MNSFPNHFQTNLTELYHDIVQMSEFADPTPTPTPTNPFFNLARLPQFEKIDIEAHADEAIRAQIDAQIAAFNAFETDIAGNTSPTFADVFDRMELFSHPLERTFGIIHHLSSVADTDVLRTVKEKYIGELADLGEMCSSSVPLFEAMGRIDVSGLSPVKARVVQLEIDGMRRSGFGLPDNKRVELVRINKRLSELSMKFEQNASDANKATYEVRPEHRKVVSECPDFATASWRSDGSTDQPIPEYVIGMSGPSVSDALQYIANTDVRREIYMHYIARAGTENENHVREILCLRQERAELLGFTSHADYVLQDKMVRNVEELDTFYEAKYEMYADMAKTEMQELESFAGHTLNPWDMAFHMNLKDKHDFGFTDEDTKEFFELDAVMLILHSIVEELFGVRFAEVGKSADNFPETWHPDVRYFEVYDRTGTHRASMFYDPYVRPGIKRGGAWMQGAVDRSCVIETDAKPMAYIVCNQSPPEKQPDGSHVSLMTANEVITLFHELGHAINHMLTDIDVSEAAGCPGAWDAVEIQSQQLELFATNRTILDQMVHYKTGEHMPAKMIDFIIDSNADKGAGQCRQMFLGNLDMELHRNWPQIESSKESVWAVQERIYNTYMKHGVYVPTNRLLATFGHIFSGGYSAGYYGYMFSKEISKRLYASLVDAPNNEVRNSRGRHMLDTVYAMGDSMPMGDIIDLYFERIK